MRKLTLGFLVLVLAVAFTGLAVAKEDNPKTLKGPAGFRSPAVLAYVEGFEGAFPPAGWTHTITNPSYTWLQDFVSYFEGAAAARIPWQDASYQYEVLSFQHFIDVAADEYNLSFATMGSTYWTMNADFTVEVDGVEVWSFYDSFTAGNFIWDIVSIDLSAYDQQLVTISFVYDGNDGADHHLDAVSIAAGPPPPPPPPTNDLCEDAIDLQEQGLTMFQVDLCLASNSYNAAEHGASCTGYSSNGNDVVYKIYLAAGQNFTISQQGAHDSAIWLVTDCSDPAGTCVAGADVTFTGGIETINFTATTAGWYYVIIDGWSSCSLTTVWVDAPIATQNASWSSVKTLYR